MLISLPFIGKGLNYDDLLIARKSSKEDFDKFVWTAIVRNYSSNNPLYDQKQRDAAFEMLSVLVKRNSVGIAGYEIKAIIQMARSCW